MSALQDRFWKGGQLTPVGVRFVRECTEAGEDVDQILSRMGSNCPRNARVMIGLYVRTTGSNGGSADTSSLPNMYVANGKLTKVGKDRVHALATKSATITAQEILDEMGITEISERSMRAFLAHAPSRRPPKKKKKSRKKRPSAVSGAFVVNGRLTAAGKVHMYELAAKSATITAQEILDEMGITEISERSMRAFLAHAPSRRPPRKKKK